MTTTQNDVNDDNDIFIIYAAFSWRWRRSVVVVVVVVIITVVVVVVVVVVIVVVTVIIFVAVIIVVIIITIKLVLCESDFPLNPWYLILSIMMLVWRFHMTGTLQSS